MCTCIHATTGLLHHTLRCCIDLTTRCRTVGRLEAYLEAAALRSEFKTIAGDIKLGLDRLETDHVHVPVDVADDVAVLSGQLAAVEFSVASDQEVAAAEIHRMVLLERAGLAHDQQIVTLIKVWVVGRCWAQVVRHLLHTLLLHIIPAQDVLKHCGLAGAPSHIVTQEASGLRRRAAEAHQLHDHVHELVLHKVADILVTCICPAAAESVSDAAACVQQHNDHQCDHHHHTPTVDACATTQSCPDHNAASNPVAHTTQPPSTTVVLMQGDRALHPLPPIAPRPPAAPADPCPPERKPSLIRRLSCGSMASGLLSPTTAGGGAGSAAGAGMGSTHTTVAVGGGGGHKASMWWFWTCGVVFVCT